jgi:predicted metal-binding membrane protein
VVTSSPPARGHTLVELIARHDRAVLLTTLIAIALLCWAWLVPMARDMYGAMSGPSAWMMTASWDARHVALLFAMWTVMMVGMMLPSASPLLLLYAGAVRKGIPDPALRQAQGAPSASRGGSRVPLMWNVYTMAAGYVVVWAAFSAIATLLQRLLATRLLLSPMMEAASPLVTGTLLIVAGAYQLTPLKGACLQSCRSPLAFIATRWRSGIGGAFSMGVEHGLYCLGCCWALMLLLFAGGVMNLWVITVLTGVVLVEKFAPAGAHVARLIGVLLVAAGLWITLRVYFL